MKNLILIVFMVAVFIPAGKAQSTADTFDEIQFYKNLDYADRLLENEFYRQLAVDKLGKDQDISQYLWFSYNSDQIWYTVGGNSSEHNFKILYHVAIDSLNALSEYKGSFDTLKLTAAGNALANANVRFQIVSDSCGIYFNSFVIWNTDQTISIWFLPAYQPSGQAIYGCEWEYIFNETGSEFLRLNSRINPLTAVWIGQPRELWLNYRNTNFPTIGSLYFAQSFHVFFTRIRIDTQLNTSTTAKDYNGIYSWSFKMK